MTPEELYRFDLKLGSIGAQMTRHGFAFDAARALPMQAHLMELEAAAQLRADQAYGKSLNLHSPKQLAVAFIQDLKAPILKRSEKTGEPSLDAEVLQQFAAFGSAQVRELAAAILSYRRASKLRTVYVDAPLAYAARDGRVHCGWLAYGTVSGRFASNEPNLQNLPRKAHDLTTAVDKDGLRSLYIAPPRRLLVSFDAAQLEARIAAYFSSDPAMIEACEGADFHATNAERLFRSHGFTVEKYLKLSSEKPCSDPKQLAFLKKLRDDAKQAGFACNYQAEAPTLLARLVAEGHKANLQMAEALLSAVRRTFHVYFKHQAAEFEKIKVSGYVYSPICKRRRFIGHEPKLQESSNFPIQSGAADYINIRTMELHSALQQRFPSAFFVAQVHDALTIEADEEEAPSIVELCKEVMQAPIEICGHTAVLPVEVKVNRAWS